MCIRDRSSPDCTTNAARNAVRPKRKIGLAKRRRIRLGPEFTAAYIPRFFAARQFQFEFEFLDELAKTLKAAGLMTSPTNARGRLCCGLIALGEDMVVRSACRFRQLGTPPNALIALNCRTKSLRKLRAGRCGATRAPLLFLIDRDSERACLRCCLLYTSRCV